MVARLWTNIITDQQQHHIVVNLAVLFEGFQLIEIGHCIVEMHLWHPEVLQEFGSSISVITYKVG